MKVTASTKTAISNALSAKEMSGAELARAIGKDRSWVSKLLTERSTIQNIDSDTVDLINDTLDIILNPLVFREGTISPTAHALSELSEHDPDIALMMESILKMASKPEFAFIPHVKTKELSRIGGELRKIFEKRDKEHNPKAASEALDYLRNYFLKNS